MDDSAIIMADTSKEKINLVIQLTGTLVSAVHEYLWGIDEVPDDPQKLIDELHSMGKILARLRKSTLGDAEFRTSVLQKLSSRNGPLSECAAELNRLRLKMGSDKGVGRYTKDLCWLSDKQQIISFISRLEKHKGVFSLALQLLQDQSELSEVIAEYERQSNSGEDKLRPVISVYNPQARIAQIEERRKSLDWLHSGNFENRYLGIQERRLKGTGEWLLQSPIFQKWMKGEPGFLLLWGRAIGNSKIVDHIKTRAQKQNIAVAYVFFDRMDPDQEQPNEVLSSLIMQVACQSQSFSVIDRTLWSRLKDQQVKPNLQKLSRNLIETSKSFDRVFLILDGLDEYGKREDILPLLHTFANEKIGVFVSSQPQMIDMQNSLQPFPKIDLSARSEDIKILIEQRIDGSSQLKRLLGEGQNRDKFISELTACANGIFLFAHLLITPLTIQPTIKHIFQELERLKSLLRGADSYLSVYTEVIGNVRGQGGNCASIALKILTWLVKAQRVLTTGELREAISVEAERYELKESDLPDKETMLAVCAGLITIDQDSNQVHLIHHTARECLVKGSMLPYDADYQVAMACITYASFDDFSWRGRNWNQKPETPWKDRLKAHPFFEYAAENLSAHINACSQSLTTEAFSRFIRDSDLMSCVLRILEIPCETKEISPLHVAALIGHVPVVRELLKKKRERLDRDKEGRTVLHYAVRQNHQEIVCLLLEDGRIERQYANEWELAEMSVNDEEGKSVLHWAARRGFVDIVMLLLRNGADIEVRGRGGQTALHEATRGGHLDIVKLLVERGARVWAREEVGRTALHVAAKKGHLDIVKYLLRLGSNVSAEERKQATSPYLVQERDHVCQVVRRYVDLRIGVSADDHELQTPLHLAALGSHTEIVRQLLEEGADVLAQDTSLETPLHQAARTGDKIIVQLLVDYGADVSAKTTSGITVLHRAATRGYIEIIRILLDNGADVLCSADRRTVLMSAIDGGHEETVHLLLKQNTDVPTPAEVDEMLVTASEAGCSGIVELFLNQGAKTSGAALYIAAQRGYKDVANVLLDGGADILLQHDGQTLLHIAAHNGHDDVVQLFLENGSNVEAQDKSQQTALHKAASPRNKENAAIIYHLLEAGADVSAKDDCAETALILAAKNGLLESVQILVANGADTSISNINGWTALHQVANKGYCGYNYGGRRGRAEIVKLLLDNGADIRGRNQSHQTALHVAASWHDSNDVIRMLLERGADINEKDDKGRTALMVSIINTCPDAAKLLIERGADIKQRDKEDRAPFIFAVEMGLTDVVKMLIDKGADTAERDKKGRTAFMLSVVQGRHGVAELLLRNGARVSEKDETGQSALFLAAGKGFLEVVRVLLERGANIAETNTEGQTALFMAADGWHREVFYFLVEKGANKYARDRDGKMATLEDRYDDDDGGWSPPEPWYPQGW